MAEKKPGLLKRMFSFGFGKKEAEEDSNAEIEKKPITDDVAVKKPTKAKAEPKKAPKKTASKVAPKTTPKAEEKAEVKKTEAKKANVKKVDAKTKTKAEAKPVAKKQASKPSTKKEIKKAPKPTQTAEPIAPPASTKPSDKIVTLTERKSPTQPEANKPSDNEDKQSGWLSRLTKGLSRSSEALTQNITKVFVDKKLDDDTLQDLEDVLLQADLGIETATKIIDTLAAQKFGKTVTDQEVREIMADEIEKILSPIARDLDLDLQHQPHVILMIGVNGSGKTTTIGKLSQKLYDAGFSTSLVAGDTFRAAAVEQLKIWGERTQSPVLFRETGADAAGLAFDAWEETHQGRRDVMLMDTAGRLQNRTELMDELKKIVRVLKKQDPTAPHTVLLTLDATTGQNALNQVEIFKEVAGVNGIVMTKLDGTARGGILVAIAAKFNLPVYFIGVGEGVDDLEPFEARDFARSIAGLPKE